MSPRRLVVPLALAVALAGCNRELRAAVSRAEAAAAAGDEYGAAVGWRDACRLDPSDAELCARARAHAGAFAERATAAAAPACAAGDPDRCSAAIRPAFDVAPEDPEVLRLLDETGRLHADRCPRAIAGAPAVLVSRLACLEAWRDAVPTSAYRERLAGEARELATLLVQRAAAVGTRERPAAVHALLASAACLDPAHRAAAERADRGFRGHGVPLALDVRIRPGSAETPDATRLCDAVRADRPVFACGGAGEPIRLAVELELSPPHYAREVTERTVPLVVGTRQVPNPEYEPAAERARLADQRLVLAERDARHRRDRCEADRLQTLGPRTDAPRTTLNGICDRADEAEREVWRLDREAAAARDALAAIPPTLAEDLIETYPYRETLHRWTAAFAARIGEPGGPLDEATPAGAVLVHEDFERPAIPDAGVKGDAFEDLPPGRFVELATDALRAPLAARADGALLARARAREAACDGEGPAWSGPWLACRAEAAFWQGRPIEGELLRGPGAAAPIGCR